jgi:hypothetical protein
MLITACSVFKDSASASMIRPRQGSIFSVKSIRKVFPKGTSGADYTIIAKIESASDLGNNFNGSLRLGIHNLYELWLIL